MKKFDERKTSLSEKDIKKYKQTTLKILVDFDLFLKKHEIKYSLTFGTLLGAIRHNGFIPWDDDIDIILSQNEYQRLLCCIKDFENEKYKVVCPFEDTFLSSPKMIKIYDKTTCIKEMGSLHYSGAFIDIFTEIDICDFKRYKMVCDFYRSLTTALSLKDRRINCLDSNSRGTIAIKIFSLFVSRNILVSMIRWFYNRKTSSEYCVSSFGTSNLYRKDWFQHTIPHKFEEYEFPIPKNYDEVLTVCYGDYLSLPPIGLRNPHHLSYFNENESFENK